MGHPELTSCRWSRLQRAQPSPSVIPVERINDHDLQSFIWFIWRWVSLYRQTRWTKHKKRNCINRGCQTTIWRCLGVVLVLIGEQSRWTGGACSTSFRRAFLGLALLLAEPDDVAGDVPIANQKMKSRGCSVKTDKQWTKLSYFKN